MPQSINLNGRLISFSKPIVQGILNVTPDSFFDGGKYLLEKDIKYRTQQIIDEGASIIDLGAYSSRPGADDVSIADELARLQTALTYIREIAPDFPISIDTFRAEVVEKLFQQFGTFIVNDITGGEGDKQMFETVAKYKLPYILMHMRGTPQNMQSMTDYDDLQGDIMKYFARKVYELHNLGVSDIILDLGFGFSKTLAQNYELLSKLDNFKIFELPLLVGVSRKSMIYKALNCLSEDALNGTTVLNTIAIQKGASILRVHDVKEAIEVIKLCELIA